MITAVTASAIASTATTMVEIMGIREFLPFDLFSLIFFFAFRDKSAREAEFAAFRKLSHFTAFKAHC
jgi:hypothetical protein